MVACFRPSLSWTCVIELAFTNHDKTLAVKRLWLNYPLYFVVISHNIEHYCGFGSPLPPE